MKFTLAIMIGLITVSQAAVFQWSGNGHLYEPVSVPQPISWTAAKAAAAVPPHAGPPPPHAGPPPPKANGGSRPRRAKLKINNSNLLMPFHDITDDPYFIRV